MKTPRHDAPGPAATPGDRDNLTEIRALHVLPGVGNAASTDRMLAAVSRLIDTGQGTRVEVGEVAQWMRLFPLKDPTEERNQLMENDGHRPARGRAKATPAETETATETATGDAAEPHAPRHGLSDRGQAAVDAYATVLRLSGELEQANRELNAAVILMLPEDADLYYQATDRMRNPSGAPAGHAAPETPGG